ncbi:hypothetical protein GCM10009718_10760 [Isoptericola halotolerans]|uniref:DUF624 domain-containing protein n=1 Tax=Isoptericola halotolerans TaxID=300560 RepID=A0ABX2A2L5_9MICO|nr:glycosyltransferase [Isoptericola halotolerans]NOV96002.1 hypothetical protein [Isoptericola halotolerans]
MAATTSSRDFGDGTLSRVTRAVYWYLVVGVLTALGCAPTLVLTALLDRSSGNVLLVPLCLVPAVPVWSAALFAIGRRHEADEAGPARTFARGLRLTARDVLVLAAPALALLGVIATSVVHHEAAGVSVGYAAVLVVVGVGVVLWLLQVLLLCSAFTFRTRDAARLALELMGRHLLPTAGLLALLVVAGAVVFWFGEAVLTLFVVVWLWFLLRTAQPVLEDVRRRFVA